MRTKHFVVSSGQILHGSCPLEIVLNTVEPNPVDTPRLWKPHCCGHFSVWPVCFLCLILAEGVLQYIRSTQCSVDISILWTLFVRPSGVHITEVLLHYLTLLALP